MAASRTTKGESGIPKPPLQEICEVKLREPPVTLPGILGVRTNLNKTKKPLKSFNYVA